MVLLVNDIPSKRSKATPPSKAINAMLSQIRFPLVTPVTISIISLPTSTEPRDKLIDKKPTDMINKICHL